MFGSEVEILGSVSEVLVHRGWAGARATDPLQQLRLMAHAVLQALPHFLFTIANFLYCFFPWLGGGALLHD